ncbi:MAG: PaaI family thioesterase [Phycisphaerales bacterium]|nr:PaaI family thioesterase [Hyphomonadaceae bacterium]
MPPIEITKADYDAGRIGADFTHPPCAAHLNARFESHDSAAGILRISFVPRPEFANPGGTVQGGFIAAMMDDTMGPVVFAATGGAKVPVTCDLNTSYFAAPKIGARCYVEARIEKLGGSIAFTSAALFNEAGDVLAKATQTARLVDAPKR